MLCLVPTPIGNLEDISKRSLQVLQECELIFCEDTRVTKKLLSLLGEKNNLDFSNKEYKSYHSHNEKKVLETLSKETFTKNVVYVSDAGMPCVSDPGATLVDYCIQNDIKYDVLPGANAVLTAYAMSGFTHTTFSFHGFLDHKGTGRASKLNLILNDDKLAILYESPHRLDKLLEELNKLVPNRTIFLAKEITKLHQTTYKNTASNLYEEFKNINIRGEWVVVIEPLETTGSHLELKDIEDLDLPPKIKAKLLAKMTGKSTKEVYQQILDKI
jgi:16S rRNA (cytidine1402-2'-O)-methyltransferase